MLSSVSFKDPDNFFKNLVDVLILLSLSALQEGLTPYSAAVSGRYST